MRSGHLGWLISSATLQKDIAKGWRSSIKSSQSHVFACVCVCVCVCTCICVHMCVDKWVCMYACVCVYACMCMHVYICAYHYYQNSSHLCMLYYGIKSKFLYGLWQQMLQSIIILVQCIQLCTLQNSKQLLIMLKVQLATASQLPIPRNEMNLICWISLGTAL